MGNLLLSYFSAATLSWAGFIVLVIALVGEAGIALIAIVSTGETIHKELAFVFAIVAAAGYAVERVGDDAIIKALENRAEAAEGELKKIEGPRNITEAEHSKLASCLKAAPTKGIVHIAPGMTNGDAPQIGEELAKIFDEAGGFDLKPAPQGGILSWGAPGIFLVVTDLHHAPQHATEIQKCFWVAGLKIFGYADPKHDPETVTIGIGSKL
jgi:hypothetical protein